MVRIKVGESAPLFNIESYNAHNIDLESILKKNKVILIFSRYFGCQICQMEFVELLENLKQIKKKKAKILFVTQSKPKTTNNYISKYKIDFPIILSSNSGLFKTYGLGKLTLSALGAIPRKLKESKKAGFKHGKYEGSESQCPGQFVIDKKGIVIHAFKGWLDINAILDVL